MDSKTRESVKKNIFSHSLPSVEPWDEFLWHYNNRQRCDTNQLNSSQALAISVFGYLKLVAQSERDLVMNTLALKLGLPHGGPWEVDLEWLDKENRLREKRRSQIDAVARSPNALIFFECKFTEKDGGSCSQTQRLKGHVQCDGNYREQVDRINGIKSQCALSGKGIRYWEVIPQVFNCSSDSDQEPCPFAGPWYQWMRNIVLCYEIARSLYVTPAFVIAYADSEHFSVSKKDWSEFKAILNRDAIIFDTISYQNLLKIACDIIKSSDLDDSIWKELRLWVDRRIKAMEKATVQ
ncbi:MAG: hypothetical protein GF315_05795 [candidate division Zixibacteria bacterium]|nr:hypothetical protein [candidate division Zixibacteria bacterium]